MYIKGQKNGHGKENILFIQNISAVSSFAGKTLLENVSWLFVWKLALIWSDYEPSEEYVRPM